MYIYLQIGSLLSLHKAKLNNDTFVMSVFVSAGRQITLQNVSAAKHGAEYECVLLTAQTNSATSVTLRVEPVIVEHPRDQLVSIGKNFYLNCSAESYPYPEYQWQKYNTTSRSYYTLLGENSNVLEFTSVQHSDYGVYRCVATAPVINAVAYSNNATFTGQ